jgi:signal transduction histidine kinase
VVGTGLGLSIAQATAQAHGGRIDVTSTLGTGTTFRVHLPDAHSR